MRIAHIPIHKTRVVTRPMLCVTLETTQGREIGPRPITNISSLLAHPDNGSVKPSGLGVEADSGAP